MRFLCGASLFGVGRLASTANCSGQFGVGRLASTNFLKVHRRDSSVVSQFLSDAFPLWSQSIRCRPASQRSQLLRSIRCRPASQHSQLLRSRQVLRLGEEVILVWSVRRSVGSVVWNVGAVEFSEWSTGESLPSSGNLRAPCPASLEFSDGFAFAEMSTGKTHRGP